MKKKQFKENGRMDEFIFHVIDIKQRGFNDQLEN